MISPCLTLSNIRYVSRVKWSNPGKGVAPTPTLWCSSYWKRSLRVALDYSRQLYLFYWYSHIINNKWNKSQVSRNNNNSQTFSKVAYALQHDITSYSNTGYKFVGWLVRFYGISTLIADLMPSPTYMYINDW